jgi:hypothetical protein
MVTSLTMKSQVSESVVRLRPLCRLTVVSLTTEGGETNETKLGLGVSKPALRMLKVSNQSETIHGNDIFATARSPLARVSWVGFPGWWALNGKQYHELLPVADCAPELAEGTTS